MILFFLLVVNTNASVVYVSTTNGDDSFDGKTQEKPLRSIKKALLCSDTILLKCGDVFYEDISLYNHFLSYYDEGVKPRISGYKRIKSAHWEREQDNIWKIRLAGNGFSGFLQHSSSLFNNVGGLHEYDIDSIHGRKLQFKNQLKEDWDFWQTNHYKHENTSATDFDFLYLYLSQDPNLLNIEFSVGAIGVTMRHSTIDGIRIEGFGRHGILGWSGSVIRNCDIDGIGGMTQIGYEKFVSLGNGIEFYISEDISNCLVERCRISRCYDCGITIQGAKYGQATPTSIIVKNNLITNCCQGWEDFLRNDDNIVYHNCSFLDNIILNSGKTSGFNYPSRFKYCHILGNNFKGDKGMIIRNNTFVGGNYYCSGAYNGQYKSNTWIDNICYIKRGDYILSNYLGTKDVIRIPKEKGKFKSLKLATDDAIARYREMTGDKTTKFIIKSDDYLKRKIESEKRKYENRISKL